MDKIKLRKATKDDASALAELSGQLGYPSSTLQIENRLDVILESNEHVALVACLADGSVVGCIHVFLSHRILADTFAELGMFVIAEQHRRCGIGNHLLAAAEEWVAHRGLATIRTRSRSGRIGAHEFYERMGFKRTKEQYIFDKSVKTNTLRR